MGFKHNQIDLDTILHIILRDTEKNNNISVLGPWLIITEEGGFCYYDNPRLSYRYTFSFGVNYVSVLSEGIKKHFYYTDDKILNLFLTTDLSKLNNVSKRMYETIKSKIILSLL